MPRQGQGARKLTYPGRKPLRAPTQAERKAGLPQSEQEAIKRGITRFIDPKTKKEKVIRNYGPYSFRTGKGYTVEDAGYRKANRGGGTGGKRSQDEQLATPPQARSGQGRQAYGRAMANARAQGMDGDHVNDVARTANGIRWKEQQGRGTADQYHSNMAKAGVAVGNQAANVKPLPADINQRVKPAELRALDQAINKAGYEANKIFGELVKRTGAIGYVAKQHDMPKASLGGRQELLLEQDTPLPKPMGTAPTQRQVAGDLLQKQAKLAANRFGIVGIGLAD